MNDDTDSDGLCDMIEISIVKSNPTVKDTDGDGSSNWGNVPGLIYRNVNKLKGNRWNYSRTKFGL